MRFRSKTVQSRCGNSGQYGIQQLKNMHVHQNTTQQEYRLWRPTLVAQDRYGSQYATSQLILEWELTKLAKGYTRLRLTRNLSKCLCLFVGQSGCSVSSDALSLKKPLKLFNEIVSLVKAHHSKRERCPGKHQCMPATAHEKWNKGVCICESWTQEIRRK